RTTELRGRDETRPEDIKRHGRVRDEPFSESADGQTSTHALVRPRRPSVIAGSLRRTQQPAGYFIPRVAPGIPEAARHSTTHHVTAPMFDTVPIKFAHQKHACGWAIWVGCFRSYMALALVDRRSQRHSTSDRVGFEWAASRGEGGIRT